jgi:hypothetical protein
MEQLASLEQPYIDKARRFVADNTPAEDELDTYTYDRLALVHEGEKVWIAKNINSDIRVFELFDGTKHSKDAVLTWNTELVGLEAYTPTIYREGAQAAFDYSMPSASEWASRRGLEPDQVEEVLLGMVLTKIEELTV